MNNEKFENCVLCDELTYRNEKNLFLLEIYEQPDCGCRYYSVCTHQIDWLKDDFKE